MELNKKRVLAGVLGLIALSASGIALAGAKWINEQVVVSSASRYGRGALGFTRNTSNSVEYIGCTTQNTASTATTWVYCSARDAGGTVVSCGAYSDRLAWQLYGLNGDSHLTFYYNSSGTCTDIFLENYSGHAPKAL